nr:immunoglobulin heavy chain junction region [Macaca mulatta]MOW86671.1 immunoglobulin heavy chain junction region [Macaca mulatta]MOW86837.1 immunoglobulin heavy chain junction region [Macaca mulatta]MOW86846.1 immunoglobulin heavy chain junction region [Macaca mulatta]MOW86850.1 immunoglobulin heavy chain junction region [Macaca mulatta]
CGREVGYSNYDYW